MWMQTILIIFPDGDWQNIFTRSIVTYHIPKAVMVSSSADIISAQPLWLELSFDYILRCQMSCPINSLVFAVVILVN